MKRVRMLTGMAGTECNYAPGQVISVRDDVAEAWQNEEPPIAVVVPDEIETASVNPPRTAAMPAANRKRRGTK